MVAVASESRMRLTRGIWCASSKSLAFLPTATSVPMLSNRSINRNTKMISRKPIRSVARDVELEGGGREVAQAVGLRRPFRDAGRQPEQRWWPGCRSAWPRARATPAAPRSAAVRTAPARCSCRCRLPSVTVVAGSGTMMPELRNPISAMNRPTPAATAAYSSSGMAEMMSWRTPSSGEQQKRHAGEEHRAQRRLPRHAHALHHGVGEVGVQPHAGRQRDRDSAPSRPSESCRSPPKGRSPP